MIDYQQRRQNVQGLLRDTDATALFLVPSADLRYLTGFCGVVSDRLTCLVVTQSDVFFLVPTIEAERLPNGLQQTIECRFWNDSDDPYAIVLDMIPQRAGTLLVSDTLFSRTLLHLQALFPHFTFTVASKILSSLRAQKDEEEILCLRIAQQRAGNALLRVFEWGLQGKTEEDVARQLQLFCEEEGLGNAGWGPLVAAGEHASSPHHKATAKRIAKGEGVLIDFGGTYEGYHADMTRTPFIGQATEQFKEVYHIVQQANAAAFAMIRPTIPCDAIDKTARDVIESANYGNCFTHRLGHGIGLELHENPFISLVNSAPLLTGMTFSDEPGIYIPDCLGVRIEDVVLVTDSGAECLTTFSHALIEL
jgi:Xaa-Pro aminopeptidase